MEDNPGLSPRIRARYRSSYSGVFYRRFILGEWTAAQGLVYDFFDRPGDVVIYDFPGNNAKTDHCGIVVLSLIHI